MSLSNYYFGIKNELRNIEIREHLLKVELQTYRKKKLLEVER